MSHALAWSAMAGAIALELVGTTALRLVSGERGRLALGVTVVSWLLSFVLFAVGLRVLPLGLTYAVWSGVGTATMALVGARWFGEHLDRRTLLGMALVIGGVVLLDVGGR